MTKTILITGATDGLGRGVAYELAKAGHTVLVHGRDRSRAEALARELGDARVYIADLSSLEEVRAFASEVLAREARLDVLVNNAGIGTVVPSPERQESREGIELRFAVNYLSHYLLTRQLLPLLEKSAPARIVNVSSAGQMPIDFDDPMITKGYSGNRAYCQSKLAQITETFRLAPLVASRGISVNALHPATFMATKIVPNPISGIEEGVAATVRLAIDAEVDGVTGKYFDGKRESRANAQAYDIDARTNLHALSEKLVSY